MVRWVCLKRNFLNINFLTFSLKLNNVFVTFYNRIRGLFLKMSSGLAGFIGPKKSTTYAYQQVGFFSASNYFNSFFFKLVKSMFDSSKRKIVKNFFSERPLFIYLNFSLINRQLKPIFRGFRKARLKFFFVNYRPKTAHNGMRVVKKRRV